MTYRNRSRRGLGLLALMLLAFGLAACGGSEPTATVPPPAPPPAPPPFVPQAVEVALGTSGETLTLMTTDAGGYTLNGEAFATGTEVMAEANGSTYTLTLEGATWSAAYKMPEAMSLALGTTGGSIAIERLEDGSFQANGSALAAGTIVTAANGNMYTVLIADDGRFSAEYVVPPALSIPLGSSGSAVDVTKNEDGTFSAMVNGERRVITAETTVTAADGNLYRAILAPDGSPVGVMHIPAMQEVMLGELGGTITLTQAEDHSWWYGEMGVESGYVHTAANGNMYTLTLDSEGMWSAMYQKVEVMVDLGTQGSITLVRAEDMSWWLGSEAVDVASEVMADNGNTYTLWYTDGVWTARFEPESTMIEGTGLVAMTREADDMFDVGDATLPASGMGDVTVDGAMYHVWMDGGALMGARFDAAIDTDTDFKTNTLAGVPRLSGNDPDTAANEQRAYLLLTGDEANEGMFSMGALLGRGMASDEGASFVDEAMEAIEKVQTDVSALLALDSKPATLDTILESQWSKLELALDNIFGTDSDNDTPADVTSAVRTSAPREEDILDEIDDILDALSSEDAFVAATAEDGDGVFESQALGASAAANAFNRLMWSADATMGMKGSTRYGTAIRKTSDHAKDGPDTTQFGAFSYSTMSETARAADAAAVSLTGIASYSGGTRAVSASGDTYSGTMDLQVRFKANSVSGVVSGLEDAEGLPWQHNFADVDRIVLDDATLRRNATWANKNVDNDGDGTIDQRTGQDAAIFYAANSGLLRPVNNIPNTFEGRLLGTGADAGSEANGTWSVGAEGGSGYLTGGFGVMHVADASRPTPAGDDGSGATAMLLTNSDRSTNPAQNMTSVSISDGTLTLKQRRYGWVGPAVGNPIYQALGATGEETLITAKFELAALAEKNGAPVTINGPKWIDGAILILQEERDLLSTLQGLDSADTQDAEVAAWVRVQDAVALYVFGGLIPVKLAHGYADLESEADAIDLINRALDALSSDAKLEAALDPDGTGIFDHYQTGNDDDNDTTTAADADFGNYRYYDSADRRNEVVSNSPFVNLDGTGEEQRRTNGRTIAQVRSEREHKVISAMRTTNYTRFGVWRRESTSSARRNDGVSGVLLRSHGGPGTYAYSPLDRTNVGTLENLSFPAGGNATYTGETIALHGEAFMSGTARVNVTWGTPTTVAAPQNVGTMALTISGLASADGDPLSVGGSATAPGNEIADIVFPGLNILVGAQGDFANNLIVGTGTADADGNFAYGEVAATGTRYRLASAGIDDPAGGTNTVKALFVGQGVDGPLGVIGTWTLRDSDLGRISPDGSHADLVDTPIYGAFGAEVP